jgi:hypothetical protein
VKAYLRFRRASILAVLLVGEVGLIAGQQLLRDEASQADGPIERVVGEPLWDGSSLSSVLNNPDLIVRGTVAGNSVAYLSSDGRQILTDYRLNNAQVIFTTGISVSLRPGMLPAPVTVTQLGGSMMLEGKRVTVRHKGLPPLESGTDGVFVLIRRGDKYRIAGDYIGAFAIERGLVLPLTANRAVVEKYRGIPFSRLVSELTEGLRSVGR